MPQATQQFLEIHQIREGVLILKNQALRGVLMVSSLNFALKSEDEQKAVIYQFQNFLNSLDFSIQILVQSRKLDIRPYVAILEERYGAQTNDLLKVQIREYIDFIKTLTSPPSSIMTKVFYVSIPYDPPTISIGGGMSSKLPFGPKQTAEKKNQTFEENRSQLEQRVSVVAQGLRSVGLRSEVLGTEELVEVFYKMFNPGETDKPMVAN
ncbi:MAG: hypothetical protein AAB840_00675 [Patescibacteria group bacterium]